MSPFLQREVGEGESKNVSEAEEREAENESLGNVAEASYRAEVVIGNKVEVAQ